MTSVHVFPSADAPVMATGELTWRSSRARTAGCRRPVPWAGKPRQRHPNCSGALRVLRGQIRHAEAG
jgi:hypothetical protein